MIRPSSSCSCICCTLRGDLLKTVKALSEERAFDYLVIESTGISEPLPVAQTFVMNVDASAEDADAMATALQPPEDPAKHPCKKMRLGGRQNALPEEFCIAST